MRGFSLIEVMIASTILLVGIAGTTAALHTLALAQEHQRWLAGASTVAGNAMEEALRDEDARTLAIGTTNTTWDAQGRQVGGGAFRVERNVVNDEPMEFGRRIEVIVRWTERGRNKEYRLKSYAYRPPP